RFSLDVFALSQYPRTASGRRTPSLRIFISAKAARLQSDVCPFGQVMWCCRTMMFLPSAKVMRCVPQMIQRA
ncbi:MAG: hypothetical protein KBS76_04010, partial [Ruminococcus sp.]|nr:hypothetical protein [Candidatus Apopatosoma intestinale]